MHAMQEIFGTMEGVETIVDDLLIHGRAKQEHDSRLRDVLAVARAAGLKFNMKKCRIGLSEVKYVGHVISKDGLKPNPERVEAINNMPTPTCKTYLQRFLGMCG